MRIFCVFWHFCNFSTIFVKFRSQASIYIRVYTQERKFLKKMFYTNQVLDEFSDFLLMPLGEIIYGASQRFSTFLCWGLISFWDSTRVSCLGRNKIKYFQSSLTDQKRYEIMNKLFEIFSVLSHLKKSPNTEWFMAIRCWKQPLCEVNLERFRVLKDQKITRCPKIGTRPIGWIPLVYHVAICNQLFILHFFQRRIIKGLEVKPKGYQCEYLIIRIFNNITVTRELFKRISPRSRAWEGRFSVNVPLLNPSRAGNHCTRL